MESLIRIGELASAAGVSADTVRYYERRNLLPRPGRTGAGYRVYSDQDVDRLQFIARAQSLGLSLHEIKALLPERRKGLPECRHGCPLSCARRNSKSCSTVVTSMEPP